MDKVAAYRILSKVLEKQRQRGFSNLIPLIGKTQSEQFQEPGDVIYTVDITASWSDSRQESIVMRGRIDDSNSFNFSPLEEKIIVRANLSG